MKIAAAAYPVEWHDSWADYAAKVTDWVVEAAGQGADLLVFPEYAGMEAALIGPPAAPPDWLAACEGARGDAWDLWAGLAQQHGVHILGGSAPAETPRGFVNRAPFFAPNGQAGYQDKQILTKWERAHTALVAGDGQTVFDTDLGRIGVAICYDCEFPLLGRDLAADLWLFPSCTDAATGAARVRIGAQARALERQCHTVLASTVGATPDCDFLDENRGLAGVYAPPDTGFPDDGIVAQGAMDAPGWTFADVDLAGLAAKRAAAAVSIPDHWDEQARTPARPMTVLRG
ncbi:carbon-nitrogen hydrolase family protein [Actibacterium ureilyticum]|uniref:carbon-nitrogen hydrolase family protein n=1 Tax=Actibacterium ureilyticum TaxID=1590614 RepID=UPI000BAAD7A5|nr:carbon-nitrogen hydrolase family protein [Actibacterium ureilyticum]